MKCDHNNGSAHMFECRLFLTSPTTVPELIPGSLLTKHHPRCLYLERDRVDMQIRLKLFNWSFSHRIFLMILLRIKGYNRHVLSMPGTHRYQNMELNHSFQKRINEAEAQMRSRLLISLTNILQYLFHLQ